MGGHWTGHFQGGVSSPLERDSWSPSRRGHSSSAPECARQLAQAPVYFGSSALVAVLLFFFSPSRAQVPRQNPPPPCGHQGPIPSRSWQPRTHGPHLLAELVSNPGSSAPGSATRPWKPGCWLCSQVPGVSAASSAPKSNLGAGGSNWRPRP